LHKENRLSKNKDFTLVYKKGKSWANRSFVIYVHKRNDEDNFRLGISVSKKVGNAVVRNHIKRLVKAVFIDIKGSIPVGYDVVIIARNSAKSLDFHKTKEAIIHVLKRSKIYVR
jgi:ribonuclease P protein component